jgi:hypothetical protein
MRRWEQHGEKVAARLSNGVQNDGLCAEVELQKKATGIHAGLNDMKHE